MKWKERLPKVYVYVEALIPPINKQGPVLRVERVNAKSVSDVKFNHESLGASHHHVHRIIKSTIFDLKYLFVDAIINRLTARITKI